MSGNKKIKLRGSNNRNIRFTYKQGNPNWRKLDFQWFKLFMSDVFFSDIYLTRYSSRSIIFFILFLFILFFTSKYILNIIENILKNYGNYPIPEEMLISIIFYAFLIAVVVIFYIVSVFIDHIKYSEFGSIRKLKPDKEFSEKKQSKRKKKMKEDIPWEL